MRHIISELDDYLGGMVCNDDEKTAYQFKKQDFECWENVSGLIKYIK